GAFYIMLNIRQCFGKHHGDTLIHDSLSFSDSLLESRMVTVVPGIAFGADSFVRLSYANSMDNIRRGLDRMEEFVNELA
ncbi:MAG TPA: aspartate aminotransferase, partial [Clostridiales bacterium]|nr:aspartate aminotransferase [Clostridiales bacterium]